MIVKNFVWIYAGRFIAQTLMPHLRLVGFLAFGGVLLWGGLQPIHVQN
jgi:hypothetical protein